MSKEEWIVKCAHRFNEISAVPMNIAFEYATEAALNEEYGTISAVVSEWDDPVSAADDEMSYWNE